MTSSPDQQKEICFTFSETIPGSTRSMVCGLLSPAVRIELWGPRGLVFPPNLLPITSSISNYDETSLLLQYGRPEWNAITPQAWPASVSEPTVRPVLSPSRTQSRLRPVDTAVVRYQAMVTMIRPTEPTRGKEDVENQIANIRKELDSITKRVASQLTNAHPSDVPAPEGLTSEPPP